CWVNGTEEALNTPELEMVPNPLAVHVTDELKLPVPETVAVQLLVWPAVIAVGLQLAPTVVIVEVPPLLLPPPQAMRRSKPDTAARFRKNAPLLLYLHPPNISPLGNNGGNKSAAIKTASMPPRGKKKIRLFDQNRPAPPPLLGGNRLLHRLEIGTQ